ncbi:MAG: transposase, partial [Limnospira sp. PMC 894.15]|nr:transposase [Limnospira sp. PMC 894.15]
GVGEGDFPFDHNPYKAFRTKLKLNDRHRTLMAKHAGYARFVFNWGLHLWRSAYEEGLKPNINSIKKVFTNYVKPQYPWMSELSSKVDQYAFINLGDAFKRFFKGISSYPKFKKKGYHDSFTLDNSGKPFKLSGT